MPVAKEAAPAIGVSLSAELGHGHSLVMQTHVAFDVPAADLDAVLDKLRDAATRQRWFHELRSIEANIDLQLRDRRTAQDRIVAAEEEYIRDSEARHKRIEAINLDASEILRNDQETWSHGARRGEYQPSPQVTQRSNAKAREAAALQADQEKADQERANARKSHRAEMLSIEKTLEHYENERQKFTKRIGLGDPELEL